MDTKRDLQDRVVAAVIAAYNTTRLAEVGPISHIMSQEHVYRAFENLEDYSRRTV